MAAIAQLLEALFETGYVEIVNDRPLAVSVYRATTNARGRGWEVSGGSFCDEKGVVIYSLSALPPLCSGGCGSRPGGVMETCYECQTKAHAEGWYDMDMGYVRA